MYSLPPQFDWYIISSVIFCFLLIGIIKNKIPALGTFGNLVCYSGKKIVFPLILGLFLFYTTFITIDNFDLFIFLQSLIFGLPIALIFYHFLITEALTGNSDQAKFNRVTKNGILFILAFTPFVLLLLYYFYFFAK